MHLDRMRSSDSFQTCFNFYFFPFEIMALDLDWIYEIDNDCELTLRACKEIEHFLEIYMNASGRNLSEKVHSAERYYNANHQSNIFPKTLVRRIRRISRMRRKLINDRSSHCIQDKESFIALIHDTFDELHRLKPHRNASKSQSRHRYRRRRSDSNDSNQYSLSYLFIQNAIENQGDESNEYKTRTPSDHDTFRDSYRSKGSLSTKRKHRNKKYSQSTTGTVTNNICSSTTSTPTSTPRDPPQQTSDRYDTPKDETHRFVNEAHYRYDDERNERNQRMKSVVEYVDHRDDYNNRLPSHTPSEQRWIELDAPSMDRMEEQSVSYRMGSVNNENHREHQLDSLHSLQQPPCDGPSGTESESEHSLDSERVSGRHQRGTTPFEIFLDQLFNPIMKPKHQIFPPLAGPTQNTSDISGDGKDRIQDERSRNDRDQNRKDVNERNQKKAVEPVPFDVFLKKVFDPSSEKRKRHRNKTRHRHYDDDEMSVHRQRVQYEPTEGIDRTQYRYRSGDIVRNDHRQQTRTDDVDKDQVISAVADNCVLL